jgi:membrane-associated phospholipid phosphatase
MELKPNVFILLCVIILHTFVNNLEKLLVQNIFGSIRRPCKKCSSSNNNSDELACLGMPSGHVEAATVVSMFLIVNQLVPLWGGMLIVICTALQRIYSLRHTFNQVLVGFAIGLLYSYIYLSYSQIFATSILIRPIFFILLYSAVLIKRINNETESSRIIKTAFNIKALIYT